MSQYRSDDAECIEPGRPSLLADPIVLLACLAAALIVHLHASRAAWSHRAAAKPPAVVLAHHPARLHPVRPPIFLS